MPNEKKLGYLGIAGMIDQLCPEKHMELATALRGRMKGATYLLQEAEERTPISRYFILHGLTFLLPRKVVFTAVRRDALLAAIQDYEEVGPALQALQASVGTWSVT